VAEIMIIGGWHQDGELLICFELSNVKEKEKEGT
jgi:hypothetical protein